MKNSLKKLISSLLAFVLLMMNYSNVMADSTNLKDADNKTEAIEVMATRNENGDFEAIIPFKDGRNIAKLILTLSKNGTKYDVDYKIASDTVISGLKGQLVVKNTSALTPTKYLNKSINITFNSTMNRYGTLGTVSIPYNVKMVAVSLDKSMFYFTSLGRWISGAGNGAVFPVN